MSLPDGLRLGPVHLTVRDAAASADWYEQRLGLRRHGRGNGAVEMGDGEEPLVFLHEDPAARPAGRHAGLFHFALLYPSREELARALVRLTHTRTQLTGASDHRTHEALYLRDPDHNGIELACDRPRSVWPPDLGYQGGPEPLDIEDLLATVAEEGALPEHVGEGMRMGHLHLHVGDVDDGLRFYRDVVGFDEKANVVTAAFVSAGGYHHHLAFNVWNGHGVGPPPEHTAGLRTWTVELPEAADVAAVRGRIDDAGHRTEDAPGGFVARDPWGTAVTVSSST